MLFVPRKVRQFLEKYLAENAPMANLGGLYIEIVSLWAWKNGFVCDHQRQKLFSPAPNKRNRCMDCGILLGGDVKMMDGSTIRKVLGYSIVGSAGED